MEEKNTTMSANVRVSVAGKVVFQEFSQSLKEMQGKTNDFLTTLVEASKCDVSNSSVYSDEGDSDDDSSDAPITHDEIQYVIKWFQEFSEMQREDFLDVLLEIHHSGRVNGLVPGIDDLSCEDSNKKPPSLFQCRIKLYREWSQNWSQPEKDSVLASIKNMDPKFGEQFDERLSED